MLAKEYMSLGLSRTQILNITNLSKHDLYYKTTGSKVGKRATQFTLHKDHKTREVVSRPEKELVEAIIEILSDPDLPNWYRLVTKTLQVRGWYVNHKKVYRIEFANGLLGKKKTNKGRNFVKFRRVNPEEPLRILEMDIKYCWIYGKNCFAYILTVIDTFTRYVLHWTVGYCMKQQQVKEVWTYIIANYLQQANLLKQGIVIEVRNDNGKQFCAKMIELFFKENHLNQVFTHPYSPEENGHIESFHKTLGNSLKRYHFVDLEALNTRLERFYTVYNNERQHSSIANLSPAMFWALWEDGKIDMTAYSKRKATFKLGMVYQDVLSWPDINRYNYRVL